MRRLQNTESIAFGRRAISEDSDGPLVYAGLQILTELQSGGHESEPALCGMTSLEMESGRTVGDDLILQLIHIQQSWEALFGTLVPRSRN